MEVTIKRLYDKTHNIEIVANAVKKTWINAEQYKKITGEDYVE